MTCTKPGRCCTPVPVSSCLKHTLRVAAFFWIFLSGTPLVFAAQSPLHFQSSWLCAGWVDFIAGSIRCCLRLLQRMGFMGAFAGAILEK
jgi:hypothetical protein